MTTRTHARHLLSSLPATGRGIAISLFLLLITGGVALADGPGDVSAEPICVPVSFGVEECTETIVLSAQTYWVDTEGVQACQKGKSQHPAEQRITTRETRQATEYHLIVTTYAFGSIVSVDESIESVDFLVSSETISVEKCRMVKS